MRNLLLSSCDSIGTLDPGQDPYNFLLLIYFELIEHSLLRFCWLRNNCISTRPWDSLWIIALVKLCSNILHIIYCNQFCKCSQENACDNMPSWKALITSETKEFKCIPCDLTLLGTPAWETQLNIYFQRSYWLFGSFLNMN